MGNIVLKAFGFILVIITGVILRTKGVCTKEQGKFLSAVVLNITLPCSIISSAKNLELTPIMLTMLLIGLGGNMLTNLVGYISSRKELPINRALTMINMSGYNIGGFAMPFLQSFFDPSYLIYICMFDMGNSFMCTGGTFAIASFVASSEGKITLKSIFKKLFSSIPFCTYTILFLLALFKLSVPEPILILTETAARANSFLAMLVIGILLETKLDLTEIRMIRRILLSRYAISIVICSVLYFVLPVDIAVKKMLLLAFFAPVSAISPVFSARLGSKSPVPAAVNSISILVSIVMITSIVLLSA